MESPMRYATLVIRVSRDESGRVSGVVERVKTKEKVPFHGLEEISQIIARLIAMEEDHQP
jgi:hypothetical protein